MRLTFWPYDLRHYFLSEHRRAVNNIELLDEKIMRVKRTENNVCTRKARKLPQKVW
jgi:hypothetical protein